MKNTWHLCFSAGDEVLFRDLDDYNRGFNTFALALYKTDSTGLVEAFMSNHAHLLVQTAASSEFMHEFRHPYSMYFNRKYSRKGKLGEKMHFSMEVVGYHHMLAASSYILRNPLHHGVVPIPYAYPHCSVNAIFSKEMGKFQKESLLPDHNYSQYIGRRAEYPNSYKMSESGVFLRETVLDIPQVENIFVSPRSFNYYMSRKSSEEWEMEQNKDGYNILPINLSSIERGISLQDINKMIFNEAGKLDYRKTSDIELCTELNVIARSDYGKHSVYQLTDKEKQQIASELYHSRHINEKQIRRCLAMF